MDPDANLKEQRELIARINADDEASDETSPRVMYNPNDARRLIELVQALDQWITGGGFLPAAWKVPQVKRPARCQSTYTDTDHHYRCRLPLGHIGEHVDTRHPLHPTWRE